LERQRKGLIIGPFLCLFSLGFAFAFCSTPEILISLTCFPARIWYSEYASSIQYNGQIYLRQER